MIRFSKYEGAHDTRGKNKDSTSKILMTEIFEKTAYLLNFSAMQKKMQTKNNVGFHFAIFSVKCKVFSYETFIIYYFFLVVLTEGLRVDPLVDVDVEAKKIQSIS